MCIRDRGRDILKWEEVQSRSSHKETGTRESEAQGSPRSPDPGTYAFKKRDELGLTNHSKGSTYSQKQRQLIIQEVAQLKKRGIPISKSLNDLGVCRSTYYGWFKEKKLFSRARSVFRLTESERQAIITKKKLNPYLSHRKISGFLSEDGYWVSDSSCYRVLKFLGLTSSPVLREAPGKVTRYEPFRANFLVTL